MRDSSVNQMLIGKAAAIKAAGRPTLRVPNLRGLLADRLSPFKLVSMGSHLYGRLCVRHARHTSNERRVQVQTVDGRSSVLSKRVWLPTNWVVAVVWVALLAVGASQAAAETWAERLGYPTDRPVLIVNAEGMGMCYEVNAVGRDCFEKGLVRSLCAMPPCPWFSEFAQWARKHESLDVGLLITLNSPFENYRWPVLSPRTETPGLYDPNGYAWSTILQVTLNSTPEEVEREIRAQIQRARAAGIRPTHLKTFLGTLVARPDFFAVYLNVARENWLPAGVVELTPELVERFRREGFPLDDEVIELVRNYPLPKLDDLRFVPLADSYEEKRTALIEMIEQLGPGITEILFLPAMKSEAFQHITPDWEQYVWEARLLSDPEVLAAVKRSKAVLTTWHEMMRRFDGMAQTSTEKAE